MMRPGFDQLPPVSRVSRLTTLSVVIRSHTVARELGVKCVNVDVCICNTLFFFFFFSPSPPHCLDFVVDVDNVLM